MPGAPCLPFSAAGLKIICFARLLDSSARNPTQLTIRLKPLALAYRRISRVIGPRFKSLVHWRYLGEGNEGTSGRSENVSEPYQEMFYLL